MNATSIFYADDDEDDFLFFTDAVKEITTKDKESINLLLHLNGDNLLENIINNCERNIMVFLDINMPKKSGFNLLEEIRSNPTLNEVPVIMYSTSHDAKSVKISQDLGANFYAVKPYNFNDLTEMIKHFLKFNWDNYTLDLDKFLYIKQ